MRAVAIILVFALSACGGTLTPPKSRGGAANPDRSRLTRDSTNTSVEPVNLPILDASCGIPLEMMEAQNAGDVPGLLDHLNGKFEIESISFYAQKVFEEPDSGSILYSVGSFYATATAPVGSTPHVLDIKCSDVGSRPKIEVSTTIARTIHTPSNRITVFDVSAGTFDNPQFNFPTRIKVIFDSDRNASSVFDIRTAPYTTGLTYGELAATWPADQKLTLRLDGKFGFQILTTIPATEGNRQYTRVLMVYRKAI